MLRAFVLVLLLSPAILSSAQSESAADLQKQAAAAHAAKHYSEAIALLTRALPVVDESDRANLEYNLACAESLAGDRAAALDTLNNAIDDGYTRRKDSEADTDLIPLHADPRWPFLLTRMSNLIPDQDRRWGDAAFASVPYSPNLSDADKLAGLSELWAQARYSFANFWHVPNLNWDQTYRDFIPQVLATRSTADYYRVLQHFYAQLQDGHSNVYPPEAINTSPMPLRTRLIEGHLLVLGTRRPGFDLQGLHPGDEIVSINGEPAVAWGRRNVEPFISASTPQDRDNRTFGNQLFFTTEGTRFDLGIASPGSAIRNVTFNVPPWQKSATPLFELNSLPNNVVYIALNGFDDDTAAKEWDKHWPEISSAKALILDLRENGGGSDSVGAHILATLLDKPAPGELSRSTRWIASYRAWGVPQLPRRFPLENLDPDPVRHFAGPVVLLTSPRTFSAGEDMTVVFKQAHRGQIIGEPTGGSTGQPLMFKLPGDGFARICTKHDSFADGTEFVGIGIQPDIPAHLSVADIRTGRDSVLETAVRHLQSSVPGLPSAAIVPPRR